MSILKAFKLFGQKGYWQLAKGYKNGMNLAMSKEAIGDKLTVISTFNPGNFASKNKFTRALFNTMGKGVALSKVDGFGSYMFAAGLGGTVAGAGIGYLLGKPSNNNNDMQGLVVEKEEKQEQPRTIAPAKQQTTKPETPVAIVEKSRDKNYHPIRTGGLSWEAIVNTYYPELVEIHNGQLYGKDGAIRELKHALSKDNDKLDLVNTTDIPRVLNLPMEINGIKINTRDEAQKVKIKKGGHTDIQEAGKRDSVDVYTVRDIRNNTTYTNKELNVAIDSLKKKNNTKDYEIKYAK